MNDLGISVSKTGEILLHVDAETFDPTDPSDVPVITQILTSADNVRDHLAKEQKGAIRVASLIELLPPQAQIAILTTPHVMSMLTIRGRKRKPLAGSKKDADFMKQLVPILATMSSFVYFIGEKFPEPVTEILITIIRKLPHDGQVAILTMPCAVSGLLAGLKQAREMITIIKGLPQDGQVAILTTPLVVCRLADRKPTAVAVLKIIEGYPQDKQAKILAAPCAVLGLARRGRGAKVIAITRRLPQDGQTAILTADYAAWGLADNGQAAKVAALVKKLPPEAQQDILVARFTNSHLA